MSSDTRLIMPAAGGIYRAFDGIHDTLIRVAGNYSVDKALGREF